MNNQDFMVSATKIQPSSTSPRKTTTTVVAPPVAAAPINTILSSNNNNQQHQQTMPEFRRPHSARGSHAQFFLNLQKDKSDIIPVSVREAVAHIAERKKQYDRQKCELAVSATPHNPFAEMGKKEDEKHDAKRMENEKKQLDKDLRNSKLWGLPIPSS